ncbi:MAG: ATP-binding protein [Vicinamibacterales bacterium]
MTILSSLQSRIFLGSALLAVLSIAAAVLLVSARVAREAENVLRREMVATGAIVDQLRTTRTQTFTTMARLLADAPKLKAAVDTGDPLTVQDVVDGYRAQMNADLLLVTGDDGRLLATVGLSPDAAMRTVAEPATAAALAGHEAFSLLPQPDGMLQLVTVPVSIGLTQQEILGTLGVGFRFDEALAQQLKEVTGSEIAFTIDGRIVATTLPPRDRAVLGGLLPQGSAPTTIGLRTDEYVALSRPLVDTSVDRSASPRAAALILRSRTEHLRFLRTIHTELGVTAAIAVLMAIVVSFAIARTVTRPLKAITDAMRQVAATGDLTRKIALPGNSRWQDEDAQLLATTFNTLTESVARFQHEISERERLSSLGRLSTVIAHEIRNPLMIVKAALHVLREPGLSPAHFREAIADIAGEAERLNRLVNDVLDFARPITFDLAPADLNAVCRESAVAAQVGPGSAVELDLVPLPLVITDAERLRIALVNLVQNARQAMDGASPAAVRVATRQRGDRVAIVVADRGPGIREGDVSRVFDPFFTTRRGGTGLGLPIARNIVEGLGGTIAIEPGREVGTVICIELPVAPAVAA